MMSIATARPARGRLAGVAAALMLASANPTGAAAASFSPQDGVRSFYATLLDTMKQGPALGESGRFARLDPAVERLFDIPFMTRLSLGPAWNGLPPVEQQQVTAAFGRYVAATYADRFDSYSGEQLQVTGQKPFAASVIVETRIVKSNGKPVEIDYLMQRHGGLWQIADVYLDGTISQLAVRRSEFYSILRQQGVDGLITALNRKVDLLTNLAKAR
jgi:phospholipid transport system substrate-binding protein